MRTFVLYMAIACLVVAIVVVTYGPPQAVFFIGLYLLFEFTVYLVDLAYRWVSSWFHGWHWWEEYL